MLLHSGPGWGQKEVVCRFFSLLRDFPFEGTDTCGNPFKNNNVKLF